MGLICLTCKNRGEISEELKPLVESLKPFYQEIIFCKALNTLIVANPDIPTQTKSECEKFEKE